MAAFVICVVQSIDTERPDGVRDRALLLLGLVGAFRRDELASRPSYSSEGVKLP